jgi:DNA-directed RNA polymerase sigma subunit (sigma70/sigma32)
MNPLFGVGFAECIRDKVLEYFVIERRLDIERALSFIPVREAIILRLRFLEDATYEDIACCMGFTKVRARQLEKRALRRLRGVPWLKNRVPRKMVDSLKGYVNG